VIQVTVLGILAAVGSEGAESQAESSTAASGPLMQMNEIGVIPTTAADVLSAARGLDLDHDGQREFILRRGITVNLNTPLEVYECTADDTFVLVHTLDLENNVEDLYVPADAGDIDGDGLADLVVMERDVIARGVLDFGTEVYESDSPNTYPTEFAWGAITRIEDFSHAAIGDTDADGKQEIIVVEPDPKLVIYEDDGDDSYNEIYSADIEGISTGRDLRIANDLDGDGIDEILFAGSNKIVAFESTGDNTYELIWTWASVPLINVEFIVDAGDLDGDGKREFLAGGLKLSPFQLAAHVFEAVSDNDFEIVATFANPYGDLQSQSLGAVADVDGDGLREIVLGSGNTLRMYALEGGSGWSEVWTNTMGNLWSLGTGDNDGDGKDELIVGEAIIDITSVWEISPLFVADPDHDGVVTVIDNCPMQHNPGQEDADSDDVGNLCDNCVYGPNTNQLEFAPLGQEITSADKETFSWPNAAEVVYVVGDLADVSAYAVDTVDSLALTTSLSDGNIPASGAGFYYLVRPDCLVGSWQTTVGAEPLRDPILP